MWNPFAKRADNNIIRPMVPMYLAPLPYRATQEDQQNYVWPNAVTQYGRKVTNCWMGNQLPSSSTTIGGYMPIWMYPRSFQNSLLIQQNSRGMNIQTVGQQKSYNMVNAASNAWLKQNGYSNNGR